MTQDVLVTKSIKPQRLKIDAIRLELLNELRAEGRDQVKEENKTIATWQHDKPTFEFLISLTRSDASVLSGPGGNPKGIKKWNWLNEGTRVRRAVMSSNWRSKTKPGRLRSGWGRGRVVFISKRIARPGIEARGWSEIIQKRRKRPFQRRMISAMQRAGNNAY